MSQVLASIGSTVQWTNPDDATAYVAAANASLYDIAQQGLYDGFSLDYRSFPDQDSFGDIYCDIISALKTVCGPGKKPIRRPTIPAAVVGRLRRQSRPCIVGAHAFLASAAGWLLPVRVLVASGTNQCCGTRAWHGCAVVCNILSWNGHQHASKACILQESCACACTCTCSA